MTPKREEQMSDELHEICNILTGLAMFHEELNGACPLTRGVKTHMERLRRMAMEIDSETLIRTRTVTLT
jgi:hypothetical protein